MSIEWVKWKFYSFNIELLTDADILILSDNSSESLRPSPKPKLNIDPLALLPGAKPPTRTERLEKAASFDKPASDLVATLPSAGKVRLYLMFILKW